jgi:integrase
MFNQSVCALRFLYNVTLARPHLIVHLPFAKRPRALPTVLSPEEVVRFLEAALPGRDRTLLDVAYSCGLRLKELLGLQVGDIEPLACCCTFATAGRDRLVPLSRRLLEALRGYRRQYRPTWLFPGVTADASVDRRCAAVSLRTPAAGLEQGIHPHTSGIASRPTARSRRRLLGAGPLGQSLNTTAKYLHVSMRACSSCWPCSKAWAAPSLLDLLVLPASSASGEAQP